MRKSTYTQKVRITALMVRKFNSPVLFGHMLGSYFYKARNRVRFCNNLRTHIYEDPTEMMSLIRAAYENGFWYTG